MKKLIALLVLSASGISAQETIKTFYVNDEMKRDIVTFTSKAPLETIVGRTAEIKGYVTVDADDISGTAKAKFVVDLASLKTGIGLRDRHMRTQYLQTDKYPDVAFDLTTVKTASQNKFEDNKQIQLELEGNFSLHGIARKIIVPISVTFIKETAETKARLPGDLLHIVAEFDINLTDYNIPRPQFVILKLDDRQKINIDIFASTELPEVVFAQK